MQLSKKLKIFSRLFSPFFKFALIFQHFEKKMTFTAYVFPKLETVKYMVGRMLK